VALAAAGRGAASGLAVGLAYAIRPEGLVAAAVLAVRGAWRRARGRATWRATLRGAAGFLVVAVPCVMWFHATLGLWTPTPKLSGLRAPTRDWREAEPRSLPPAPGAAAHRDNAPGRLAEIARSVPGNVARQGRGLLVLWPWPLLVLWPWPLLALSLWGLARRRGIESVPLAYLAGLPLLGLSLQPRFALAAVPALAIAATVPLVRERARAARAAAVLLLAGGAAACAWGNAPVLGMIFDGSAQFDRRAGRCGSRGSPSRATWCWTASRSWRSTRAARTPSSPTIPTRSSCGAPSSAGRAGWS
jgi:hypothetical protein